MVPHWRGAAQAQGRDGGADGRPGRRGKKGAIERADRLAEAAGIALWCQDAAGPYQAIPHAGPSWQPAAQPARQPHEYVREGTTKLLTLFRPATGEVRAEAATRATNAVLHPWLKRARAAILAQCPPTPPEAAMRRWSRWDWSADSHLLDAHLPPIRVIVVLDNLKGHHRHDLVQWCAERGILLLHTPVGGSWLNLAESVQRIIVRRVLAGQRPQGGAGAAGVAAGDGARLERRPDAVRVGRQAGGVPGAGAGAWPRPRRLGRVHPPPHPPSPLAGRAKAMRVTTDPLVGRLPRT